MSMALSYSKLLEDNSNVHLVIPELASLVGLEESIVLHQIHYWLKKCGKHLDNALWIYNTFEDWSKQFAYWSLSKLRRVMTSLEKNQLIFSKKINKSKRDHTKWYTINYEKLISLVPVKEKVSSAKKILSKPKATNRFVQLEQINITENNYTDKRMSFLTIKKQSEEIGAVKFKKRQTEISKYKSEISEKMLEVWKKVFIKDTKEINLTPTRKKKLVNAWERSFERDISKWEQYCLKINSSKFLMGEKKKGFKAMFDWLIGEGTIERVLAGEFDIGDRVPDIKQEEQEKKVQEQRLTFEQTKEQERVLKSKQELEVRAEVLAGKLAQEELEKIEEGWTEDQKILAKERFVKYLEEEEEAEDLGVYRDWFRAKGWRAPGIGFAYEQFKIKEYLKKSYEELVKEAKIILSQSFATQN